jgi:type IV secretion system protein VirB3
MVVLAQSSVAKMIDQKQLRHIPIHRALNRPDLLAGCERELLLITGLITLTLVVVAVNWIAAIFGVLFWFGMVICLRMMAKADPYMSKIYIRHIRYHAYYAAHSTPFTTETTHARS